MALHAALDTLKLTVTAGRADLVLERPSNHNAINGKMIREFRDVIKLLEADESVRVVVLSGSGRSFCAGGDIEWFNHCSTLGAADRRRETDALAIMLRELNELPRPVIGRIHGPAFGGGVGLVSVCDVAIAAEDASFQLSEVRIGVLPATISPYVIACIGQSHARATMLTGTRFSAQNACAMGLVHYVCSTRKLDATIAQVCDQVMQGAPGAVAGTKSLIAHVASHDIEENLEFTAEKLSEAWDSAEGKEGVRAFLQKESPHWRR